MLDAVAARLAARVPDLSGRIEGATAFAALMNGQLPHGPLVAYVLPLGLQGGAANAATGAFDQMVREAVGVLLVLQSTDATGARALDRLEPMIRDVAEALMGWAAEDTSGVFELVRGNIINPGARGVIGYQLEFAIADQWRILA